jgi:hypothetical protein
MLSRIRPQVVQDAERGYTVQVADRSSVDYLEARRLAKVEVDFGTRTAIYQDSLREWDNGDALTDEEKTLVLCRVEQALHFMGLLPEIC